MEHKIEKSKKNIFWFLVFRPKTRTHNLQIQLVRRINGRRSGPLCCSRTMGEDNQPPNALQDQKAWQLQSKSPSKRSVTQRQLSFSIQRSAPSLHTCVDSCVESEVDGTFGQHFESALKTTYGNITEKTTHKIGNSGAMKLIVLQWHQSRNYEKESAFLHHQSLRKLSEKLGVVQNFPDGVNISHESQVRRLWGQNVNFHKTLRQIFRSFWGPKIRKSKSFLPYFCDKNLQYTNSLGYL